MTSLGDRLAHAATPWEWRVRRHVVTLVWVSVLVWAAAIGLGWGRGSTAANRAAGAAINGLVLLLLLVRPAVRSLRRWDTRRGHRR